MNNHREQRLDVRALTPGMRDALLSEAENKLQIEALLHKTAGILITRHDLDWYSLEICDEVPYGETRERSLENSRR